MTVICCPHCGGKIGVVVEKKTSDVVGQQTIVPVCSECGLKLTSQKVVDFSKNKFGRVLCMECQKKEGN